MLYFFYRPKIDSGEVKGIDDIARLYLLMRPHVLDTPEEQKEAKGKRVCRLLGISKKKLPGIKEHSKYWAFVIKVTSDVEEMVKTELDEKDYSTETRGIRHLKNAQPAGEGVYAIITHGNHTHLAYVLEQPTELGPVQKAFQIEREGSYVLAAKNPSDETALGHLNKEHRAKLPKEMEEAFVGKRGAPTKWHKLDPVDLLNYEGLELLLVGAKEDIVEELGEAGEYLEELKNIDAKHLSNNKLFEELHLDKKKHSPKPLLLGEWK